MTYLYFNGSILPDDSAILRAGNPGFRYGDGLFETMRMEEGQVLLRSLHFDRLFGGALRLGFDLARFPNREELNASILALCKKNDHEGMARVRLALFRAETGSTPELLIQTSALTTRARDQYERNLLLGLYPDGRKACDHFSNLKSNNHLLYSLAGGHAKREGWDDILILNHHERIADSSIANLFYCRGGKVFTPALTEGPVAGVLRRYLFQILPGEGFDLSETTVTPGELETADEVFLTNAIRHIRHVGRYRDSIYGRTLTDKIREILLRGLEG